MPTIVVKCLSRLKELANLPKWPWIRVIFLSRLQDRAIEVKLQSHLKESENSLKWLLTIAQFHNHRRWWINHHSESESLLKWPWTRAKFLNPKLERVKLVIEVATLANHLRESVNSPKWRLKTSIKVQSARCKLQQRVDKECSSQVPIDPKLMIQLTTKHQSLCSDLSVVKLQTVDTHHHQARSCPMRWTRWHRRALT